MGLLSLLTKHQRKYATINLDDDYTDLPFGTIAADGAWYTNSSDPQEYGSPSGTFFTGHRPQAIRFDGTNDRTYMVYLGGGSPQSININYYDHDAQALGTKVKVADNPATVDAHANGTLAIDASGYLYVFYGSDSNHAIYVKKSTNPEDITAWGDAVTVAATDNGYPQPVFIGTDLYCFTRSNHGPFGYRKSTDSGATWGAFTAVVQFTSPSNIYAIVKLGSETPTPTIHMAWMNCATVDTNNTYSDIFYTYSDDGTATWKKRDGTALTLPITGTTADKVYESGTDEDWPLDLQLDADNNPYILSIVGTRNAGNDNRGTYSYKFHKWNGSAWVVTTISPYTNHFFDRGALRVIDSSNFKAYLTLNGESYQDGGELQEFTSTDGGSAWTKTLDITSTRLWAEHNYPKVVENAADDLQIIWSYGDVEPTHVFGWGSAGTFTSDADALYWDLIGLNIYQSGGGTTARANSRVEISTNTNNYFQIPTWGNPLPVNARYQKIRFNSFSVGAQYRFIPCMFTWQRTALSSSTRWAFALFWQSTGLRILSTATNGGTVTNTLLVATAPSANTWYTCELWQKGSQTYARVVKDDGTVIYNGSITTNDYSASTLYAAFGQYAGGAGAGTITGYYDDWVIRRI